MQSTAQSQSILLVVLYILTIIWISFSFCLMHYVISLAKLHNFLIMKCMILMNQSWFLVSSSLRGYSHDNGIIFILQWDSFQNEISIAFTWNNRSAPLRHLENDRHSAPDPDYTACNLHFRTKLTWYQNEISYQNKNFIWIENLNELIPE